MSQAPYCQMPHRAVMRLGGADSLEFLQGLISNDITKASSTEAIYALLLTPQGRFAFDFFILKDGEDFLLDCEKDRMDELITKLNFYKLRADITLTLEELSVYFFSDRASSSTSLGSDFDFYFEDSRAEGFGFRGFAAKEPDGIKPAPLEDYHAYRIQRGIAEAGVELTPARLALECNLDALGAIDFHKGCYIGQEVTSRMKRRAEGGRKRLVLVESTRPLEKQELKVGDSKKGEVLIGEILSVSGNLGLALVRLDRLEAGQDDLPETMKVKLLV